MMQNNFNDINVAISKIYEKQHKESFNVRDYFNKPVLYHCERKFIAQLFTNIDQQKEDTSVVVSWGTRDIVNRIEYALINNKKYIFAEDGYFRSILHWQSADDDIISCSIMLDDLSHHFYPAPNRIEAMLNEDFVLTNKQFKRVNALIKKLQTSLISKLNFRPIYNYKLPGKFKNKILVLGQMINDFSITTNNVNNQTIFKEMIKSAIAENPRSDVIFIAHPSEPIEKYNLSEYMNVNNFHILTDNIHTLCLFKQAKKVYVCSSTTGMEALIFGKDVVVFGTPIYAGWGLTEDRNSLLQTPEFKNRRSKKRTLQELFYKLYIEYSIYMLKDKNGEQQIEDVLDYLIKERYKYFKENNILFEFNNWQRVCRQIVSFFQNNKWDKSC